MSDAMREIRRPARELAVATIEAGPRTLKRIAEQAMSCEMRRAVYDQDEKKHFCPSYIHCFLMPGPKPVCPIDVMIEIKKLVELAAKVAAACPELKEKA